MIHYFLLVRTAASWLTLLTHHTPTPTPYLTHSPLFFSTLQSQEILSLGIISMMPCVPHNVEVCITVSSLPTDPILARPIFSSPFIFSSPHLTLSHLLTSSHLFSSHLLISPFHFSSHLISSPHLFSSHLPTSHFRFSSLRFSRFICT